MLKKISLKMGHPSRGGSPSRLPPGLFVSQVLPTSVSSPEPPVPSPVHRSERQRQTQMNARTMQLDYWDLVVREMHGKTQGVFLFLKICLWKFGYLEDFWLVVPNFLAGRFLLGI